jgi:hypothetical protein
MLITMESGDASNEVENILLPGLGRINNVFNADNFQGKRRRMES